MNVNEVSVAAHKDTKSVTAEQAALANAQAEVARLKELLAKKQSLKLKVSETTQALSVYGLNRFPVTLYVDQWERLLAEAERIKGFIAEHPELARKSEAA